MRIRAVFRAVHTSMAAGTSGTWSGSTEVCVLQRFGKQIARDLLQRRARLTTRRGYSGFAIHCRPQIGQRIVMRTLECRSALDDRRRGIDGSVSARTRTGALGFHASGRSSMTLQRSQHRRSLRPRPALRRHHAPHRRWPRPRPPTAVSSPASAGTSSRRQNLPRQPHEVLVEDHLREALIRLNPEIAAQPDRADDVLYRLRAILMGVRSDGLVKANEEFAAWLTGERSMPFGENGEHVTVRLIDFDDLERNQYVVTTQFTFRAGATEKRADLVLLVNGIPLVVIEAKTPVRASQSWLDGAVQVHDDYEHNVPELFVPNVFSIATEGKEFRYGSIGLPVELWGPWRIEADVATPALQRARAGGRLDAAAGRRARPARQLHRLRHRQEEAPHQDRRPLPAVRGARTRSSSASSPGTRRRA